MFANTMRTSRGMNHWVPLRKALRRFDLMFRRTVSSPTLRWYAAWGTVDSSGKFMPQSDEGYDDML